MAKLGVKYNEEEGKYEMSIKGENGKELNYSSSKPLEVLSYLLDYSQGMVQDSRKLENSALEKITIESLFVPESDLLSCLMKLTNVHNELVENEKQRIENDVDYNF